MHIFRKSFVFIAALVCATYVQAESDLTVTLNALEVLAQESTGQMVENLRQLFEYLRVQTAEEAVAYVKQMHEDIGSLIKALGANEFHQALGNAKQYRSVFDQVRALKDTIQP